MNLTTPRGRKLTSRVVGDAFESIISRSWTVGTSSSPSAPRLRKEMIPDCLFGAVRTDGVYIASGVRARLALARAPRRFPMLLLPTIAIRSGRARPFQSPSAFDLAAEKR